MKNFNQVEIILFDRYSYRNARQRELVRWLGTTLQYAIARQQDNARRMLLRTLKDTPAIYLS